VTTKTTSDFTGLAVVSHSPQVKDRTGRVTGTGKVYVRHVERVKLDPKSLRLRVVEILERFPEIRVLYVEINQGGDLWADVFKDLPVKYVTKNQSVKKEVRAGWLLNGYQRRRVVHTQQLPTFNAELLAFPTGLNDDQIDAVGSGYTWLTGIGSEQRTTLGRQTV
jgi:phage terminase large subunit-like protein